MLVNVEETNIGQARVIKGVRSMLLYNPELRVYFMECLSSSYGGYQARARKEKLRAMFRGTSKQYRRGTTCA